MKLLEQNHVRYGLLLILPIAICLLIMELTGQNQSFDKSPLYLAVQSIAPAVVWYLGIQAKKKQLNGRLTFKQGLRESFKMSLVFGLVSPFVFTLYYLLINPEILTYVRAAYGGLPGLSDSVVILVDMLVQFLAAIIIGTLYGAVISFFLKTKS